MAETMKKRSFDYKQNIKPGDQNAIGELVAEQLRELTPTDFAMYDGRLMRVDKRVRHSMMVLKPQAYKKGDTVALFAKGLNEKQEYFGEPNSEYPQTESHTNLKLKGAQFNTHDLVVIRYIEVPLEFTGGVPTTVVDGVVTNPKAIFPLDYDPALLLRTFQRAFKLEYKEGEETVVEGRFGDFPMVASGQSGNLGASPGGIQQNALFPKNPLTKVRVIEGDESFGVTVTLMHDLDLSSYGKQIGILVNLHTVELITEKR